MRDDIDPGLLTDAATRIIARLEEETPEEDGPVFHDLLKVVLDLLESPLGFFGYIDPDGALICPSMTGEVFAACAVEGKSIRFPPESWGGLWGEILHRRVPLFRNGPHQVPPGHLPIERSLGAPLLCHGDLVGAIHVANRDHDYSAQDVQVLELLARPVGPVLRSRLSRRHRRTLARGSAIDVTDLVGRSRLELECELTERRAEAVQSAESLTELKRRQSQNDSELQEVRQIQLELLPRDVPQMAGFDIAAQNYPQSIVSGDFYDFIPLPDGSWIIVVGDASGHDLAAAFHMVEAHAALHTYLDCGVPLNQLIDRLNAMLCRHLTGRFVSLFVARLDPATSRLEFAGAGHDAIVLRAGGERETLHSTGLVLGLDRSGRRASFETIILAAGDVVCLSTDGFYEARAGDHKLFGHRRVLETLRACAQLSAAETITRLREAVCTFTHPLPPPDDMTAVVVRKL
jgi:serine phosphatase RsbU (regulator of sigma subunit)